MLTFPRVFPPLEGQASYRCCNADFWVSEVLPLALEAHGEHLYLHVEKDGANSAWVARQLAQHFQVGEKDIGYAGLKDRHAVTRQWFSVHLPGRELPDVRYLHGVDWRVLGAGRHRSKLRRGDHHGNHFQIRLRHISIAKEILEERLVSIAKAGVPNYFGPQRFGHNGQNIDKAAQFLLAQVSGSNPRRSRGRGKKGRSGGLRGEQAMWVSAARSLIFNQVLAQRIRQSNWGDLVDGDVADAQLLPTGPMWGRGRLASADAVAKLEQDLAAQFDWLEGLEHVGLSQERRSLCLRPQNFQWRWLDNDLSLSFWLPNGAYATSVLAELVADLQNAQQVVDLERSDR